MKNQKNPVRVLVVGDVMLDRYWFGDVSRISPEAPVPIVKITQSEERLGGAANVARNAAALGAQTTLLSVVGDDDAGRTLQKLLEESQITAALQVDTDTDTIVKLRVIGRQQQLLRIDFETPPSHEILKAKRDEFILRLPDADIVVLSDYGKGGLAHIEEMIQLTRAAGKAVFVDPKGDDYSKYRHASLITPNRSEFREVVGRWQDAADMARRAQTLREELAIDALLVTRSEEGMSLFSKAETLHQPAKAREVYDVSGAGDTVIAALAVMRAEGKGWADAMHIATVAAGIVVGKLGTAVVSLEELEAALAETF